MPRCVAVGFAIVLCGAVVAAAEQSVMLNATADVGVSSVVGRELESGGRAPSTPLRQNQNWQGFEAKFLLIDFDTQPIKGWTIKEAYLHLYVAKGDLYGVGVSEVLAPWQENSGACWQFARGPKDQKKPQAGDLWSWPGSSIASVAWAHPMARYSHAGPARIRKEKVGYPGAAKDAADAVKPFTHLRIPVTPTLVASLAAGISHGFVLTDDKGQVAEAYSLIGSGHPYNYNEAEDPWVFTRDIQDESLRPKLEVIGEAAPGASLAPAAPTGLKVARIEAGSSTVVLEFNAPTGDALAYEVAIAPQGQFGDGRAATLLPRWEIVLPAKAGAVQQMPLWTLPAGKHTVGVRTVGLTGGRGAFATIDLAVADLVRPKLVKSGIEPPVAGNSEPVAATNALVYAVPDTVKVDPVTGNVLLNEEKYQAAKGYSNSNPVYRQADHTVHLRAAGNEVVAFQVIVQKGEKPIRDIKVTAGDLISEGQGAAAAKITATPNIQLYRSWYIRGGKEAKAAASGAATQPAAWYSDAAVPLREPFAATVSVPADGNGIEGQTNQSIWVDIYVPKGTPKGRYAGALTISAEEAGLRQVMPVLVEVLPLELPDNPSWAIELNCYGGLVGLAGVSKSDPQTQRRAEWEFYRLAKAHRQMINVLPYHQNGKVDGMVPQLAIDANGAKVSNWSGFDEYYGPLLDGSVFKLESGYVGPGAGTPISHAYLPFHENWPIPLEGSYKDFAKFQTRLEYAQWAKTSRPLTEAFSEEYKNAYSSVGRQVAEHFQQKGWTRTTFQAFLNNKYYFKIPFFASPFTTSNRTGSSFWLLDEPVDYDDYAANAFFLDLVRAGVKQANTPDVRVVYRTDVSQPEMTRGLWNDSADLWITSFSSIKGGYANTATVRQKWRPEEQFWHYGQSPRLADAPVDMMRMILSSWVSGSTGIIGWWTSTGGTSWTSPRDPDMAVFYTGTNVAGSGKDSPLPLGGLRMKIARRAQQDIEYLHILATVKGWDRAAVQAAIAEYADDPTAPGLEFTKLTAEQQFALRDSIVATILAGQ